MAAAGGGRRRPGRSAGSSAGEFLPCELGKEEEKERKKRKEEKEKGKEGGKEKEGVEDYFAKIRKRRRVAAKSQGVGKNCAGGNPRVCLGGLLGFIPLPFNFSVLYF